MKIVKINNLEYELVKEYKDGFNEEELLETLSDTDYFYEFDYIFGDYSYSKLRLKGFYESNNKKKKDINDIKNLENYIKKYCSFECRYFLLKKK